jgi:lipopolysaccharide/colanic/teichoic acid biosynthesis glycosyltransferase/glycosyltransferase involved in cell wall biosynthesis
VLHVVTAACTTQLMRGQPGFLREAGFDVTLVSSPGEELDSLARREGVARVAVDMRRDISPTEDVRSLWQLWRVMRQVRPVVVNFGTTKAGLLGGLAARAAGVPCRVYTLHGLRMETTRGIKRWILGRAQRIATGCAHRVICVSPSARDRAAEMGLVDRERTVVFGEGSFNGVCASRFAPTPTRIAEARKLRRSLGISPGAPVIGFVGRLARDKGIADLVVAHALVRRRLPAARLLLLGDHDSGDPLPRDTRRALESAAEVVCAGHVSDPAPYYLAMDVLALPTYREGFPTVALEASAAARPVVAFEATGTVDAVADGVTGVLVPKGDTSGFAEALLRLLGDPEARHRMGRAGQERVREKFRPEPLWEELSKLYGRMIDERGMAGTRDGHMPDPFRNRGWCMRQAVKRSMDVLGAILGLALTAPLMVGAAAAVRLTMGSPVFFRQKRTGQHGRPFLLLKFRTMTDDRDRHGRLLGDARRLTPGGRLLRRFSIDELPQLLNVLKGDMSLVGPRPLLPEYLVAYTPRERLRHFVKPGITGLAQIRGRHTLTFSQRLVLDSWYVEHWRLGLDLGILLQTIPKVLSQSGTMAQQDIAKVDDREFWRLLNKAKPGEQRVR